MARQAQTGRPPHSPTSGPTFVPLLLLAGLVAGGCGAEERMYGGFRVGSPEVLTSAGHDGRYEVKWSAWDGGRLTAAAGTGRHVAAGTPVGFATGPAGHPVAVAGDERIPLDGLPAEARHLVWSTRAPPPPARVAEAVFVAPLAVLARWFGHGGGGDMYDEYPYHDHSDAGYTTSSHANADRDRGGSGGSPRPESDRGYVPWASEPKVSR